jgi:hypothetical protein
MEFAHTKRQNKWARIDAVRPGLRKISSKCAGNATLVWGGARDGPAINPRSVYEDCLRLRNRRWNPCRSLFPLCAANHIRGQRSLTAQPSDVGRTESRRSGPFPVQAFFKARIIRGSEARFARERCELKLMGPARAILGMQVIERFSDLLRINYYVGPLLGHRQRPGPR